jgi:hypothetical protein
VHDVRVIFAGEYEPGAAHVRGELVHLVESLIDNSPAVFLFAKVGKHEIVGLRFTEFRKLEIDAPDPKSLSLQPTHQM